MFVTHCEGFGFEWQDKTVAVPDMSGLQELYLTL